MSCTWESVPFERSIEPVAYPEKVQRKEFLEAGRYPVISQEAEFINGYWNDASNVFHISRPVVIFGDHTRVLKFVDFNFVLGADGVKILQPHQSIHPKFFFYQLKWTNIPSLGYSRHYRLLKELRVLVPPLPEQRRIVSILDEAFAGLEAMRANAEKNLQNARELFDSYLKETFSQGSARWEEKPFGAICENLDSLRKPVTKRDRIEGHIPYYGASGIVDYVADHIFDEDILLVSEDGANLLARTYPIAFSVTGKCWVNNHAHVVRFERVATQRFVKYYLNSISLEPFVSGMAQPKLNQKALNTIPIPMPQIEDQETIVSKADALIERTDRLETVYQEKLAAIDELKQSILQKAFAGELTSAEAVAA